MVFSNLPHHEKDAFFSLLDEYFQSRPELVAHLQGTSDSSSSGGISSTEVKQAAGRVAAAASAFAHSASPSAPPRHAPVAHNVTPARGLQTSQSIGNVDTTSKAKMVTSSLFSKKQPQSTSPPPAPAAFAQRKNTFAPPPSRTHESPPPVQQEEEAPNGEWAEALYDYESSDPGDLQIRANQRVLVTERTTDDWWTGTFQGKSGLFPASYVKLL
ncbi:hypothetical protein V5O48_016440 [Marasmius crinis-equi]|uniref:SH3 domain-containing protein n=1 Tax=Marasmius crinis-equi TaxID=585013 RepID=A0ABR3ERQ5_9AGAR